MVRGGIERYLKTFPEGGYWKGKNFLFDRRLEQVPELKKEESLQKDVESVCCVCKAPCAEYRGQHKCANATCKVPVIVCAGCQEAAAAARDLNCPLCEEGFELRGLHALHGDVPPRNGTCDEISPGLDAVSHDLVVDAAETLHSLDGEG